MNDTDQRKGTPPFGGGGLPTLEQLDIAGKTVLVRSDLNVPMDGGRIADDTRIRRSLPTIQYLLKAGAKVVLLSHYGRPEGRFVPSMSLAPLVDPLSQALGQEVKFGVDCIGTSAQTAVAAIEPGQVILMENLRFHPEEERGDASFAEALAKLGDAYVNDAFSSSHRSHASISELPKYLPHAAGRLLEEETTQLTTHFNGAKKPLAAIVGGAKISTKLALLENLIQRVDVLIIGGAMAHTFLAAQGVNIGKSLYESKLVGTAKTILDAAEKSNCTLILPTDGIVSELFEPHAPSQVVGIDAIPDDAMMIDIGPETLFSYCTALKDCRSVVWNGPVGAFETTPFDHGSVGIARMLAALTRSGQITSVAGGGDTLAAISHAGLTAEFTYLSTAGGAFLEWLEGKSLPGIAALQQDIEVKAAHG